MMLTALYAFLAMVALDLVFAQYIIEAGKQRPVRASLWAAAIIPCNSVMVLAIVDDPWMIVPSALGAFVGTWLSIKWTKK